MKIKISMLGLVIGLGMNVALATNPGSTGTVDVVSMTTVGSSIHMDVTMPFAPEQLGSKTIDIVVKRDPDGITSLTTTNIAEGSTMVSQDGIVSVFTMEKWYSDGGVNVGYIVVTYAPEHVIGPNNPAVYQYFLNGPAAFNNLCGRLTTKVVPPNPMQEVDTVTSDSLTVLVHIPSDGRSYSVAIYGNYPNGTEAVIWSGVLPGGNATITLAGPVQGLVSLGRIVGSPQQNTAD